MGVAEPEEGLLLDHNCITKGRDPCLEVSRFDMRAAECTIEEITVNSKESLQSQAQMGKLLLLFYAC